MKQLLMFIALLFLPSAASTAHAYYNANMSGEVDAVWVYADTDAIYFRLKNQPTSHPTCNPAYFVIPGTVSPDRRKMLLSRLMMAYMLKETVNIGFDATGDCADGYIQAHRAG